MGAALSAAASLFQESGKGAKIGPGRFRALWNKGGYFFASSTMRRTSGSSVLRKASITG